MAWGAFFLRISKQNKTPGNCDIIVKKKII